LPFKSRARLAAENLVLRQQVNVLIRKLPKRLQLRNSDRLLLVWLYRLFPSILSAIRMVRPETVIRWHRRGFRPYWRWKSRPGVGRKSIRAVIFRSVVDYRRWRKYGTVKGAKTIELGDGDGTGGPADRRAPLGFQWRRQS
jgi:hypothetical protein